MTATAVERAAARRHHAACEDACLRAEKAIGDLWDALADVHRLEAWRELGYASFTEWAQRRLAVSARQSYRYLAKARTVVELATATGMSTEDAATEVPLTPPATAPKSRGGRRPSTEVVNWGKPVKAASKLRAEIAHFKPGEVPPSAREPLAELLADLQRLLGAH